LHRKAVELLQAAAQRDPTNLDVRRSMAVTLDNLGSALARAQQAPAARAAHEQAIAICEELVRLPPARTTSPMDLALDLNNLGMLENREGRMEAAEDVLRHASILYEYKLERLPV